MSDVELKSIFEETVPDFSAQLCAAASMGDLSSEGIADFRSRWARKSGNLRIAAWDDAQTLAAAELLVDGRLTYAALILFGTRAGLGRHLAQAEVIFEYRSSEASGPAQARDEHREGFFLFYDALWQTINLRNDKQSYQDGLFRHDIPTFDETSVREALLNAVSHRDYRLGGSTFVRQYSRRLEVVSPGGFPPGIRPENILDKQNPRNRRLAEAFFKCGMIERSGQGMNLMVENAIRHSKPLPSFAGTDAHEVRLTLEGTMQNPAFVRFLGRLSADVVRGFSTHDFLALDALARQSSLTPAMRSCLPALRESGAVESQGRGRGTKYMLSRDLYAALGKKGSYTRHRGLDRETNKALLLRHIRDNQKEGSPLSDLCQVLPALSTRTVRQLLDELRIQGEIKVKGIRRWALWYPIASNNSVKSILQPVKQQEIGDSKAVKKKLRL